MLSNTSVEIGVNLAEIISEAGIKLVPKQSTLLQELTSSIVNNTFGKVSSKDYIAPTILRCSLGTEITDKNIKSYNQSSHDTIMDNYIEDISELVENHISFARNVVNKEVNKLKENLQLSMSEYKYKEVEDFFNVSYYKLPDIYKSYLIENELSTYKNSSSKFFFDAIDLSRLLKDEFNIMTYVLTGDELQDSAIISWLNGVGKEKALSFVTQNIPEYSLSVNNLLDYSLINYLFYRNLLNKSDLKLGYSSLQLKSIATANKNCFGNKVVKALEQYFKDVRNGKLLTTDSETNFSYFNDKALSITVYEEVFAKLAEAGGTIEVLFGFISSENKNNVTIDTLIKDKEKYITKWNNTRSLYLISMNNSRLDIFKQLLRSTYEESLKTIIEPEQETNEYVTKSKNLGNDYIDKLQLSDIDDIDKICLDLSAKIRFRFTDSYILLNEMSEILKMDSKIEPLEAALLSSIKYVSDFLTQQIDCLKI